MKLQFALLAFCLLGATQAVAQPADLPIPAATTSEYPAGVTVRQTANGQVYADAAGHTLYGMDMRTLLRWSSDPALYCQDACAKLWQPLLAPADAKPNIAFPRGFGERRPGAQPPPGGAPRSLAPPPLPPGFVSPQGAPDWTVIAGPQGPQWVYKGWHMVYIRVGEAPGSATHDGEQGRSWNTLKFVPPLPKLVAPASVATVFADGAYALADKTGHVLFTGNCQAGCASWQPLAAPMAGRGLGEWTVSLAGDSPQWLLRGKPVYVSQEDDPHKAPPAGTMLRP